MEAAASAGALVLAASPDGIIVFDRECRYTLWNAAMERLSGVPASLAVGRVAFELFPFLTETGEDRCFRDALAGRTVSSLDRPFTVPATGRSGFYEARYAPIRDGTGAVIGGVGIVRDVTARVLDEAEAVRLAQAEASERAAAEAQARADEALRLHALVLDHMTGGVSVSDASGVIVYTNPAEDRMFGYAPGELVGRQVTVQNSYPPEENARIVGEVIAQLKAKGEWQGEFDNVRKDGTPFVTHARITALEVSGRSYWVCVQEDITEQRRAEQALRESEARFRLVADTAPVMIWLADSENLGTYFNRRWLEFTGRSLDDELGTGWAAAIHPEDLAGAVAYCSGRFAARQPFTMEFRLRRADGVYRWVLDTGVPRFADDGSFLSYIGSCVDITDRHEVETTLREAKEAAEAANRAKSEFLSTMSHELRTPLNAVAGYVDLMELGVHGPITGAQREDLGRIRRSGQYLLALINDVLNMARLDADQVELAIEDRRLDVAVADLETLMAPQLAAKGIAFTLGGAGVDEAGSPLVVRADPERLQQVLLNLLSNAVKYTPSGGRVAVTCAADDQLVYIRVTDTGRGIPADQLERIFEPFVQVDRHLTQASQQGVGLGLAISRNLARRMGGDLRAESRRGEGSTFTLTLPRTGSGE